MEIVMRGSEYQDFLQCRKKWFHGWVEKITPNKPDNKLFFGTVFHKWLELYYNNDCNALQADLEISVWFNEQDISGMEQTDIDEFKHLFKGVRENYVKKYYHNDVEWNVLGTEVEFTVLLDDGVYFTGTIDLVYELNGKVYFSDHKTVASLDMYEEKSKMDRQISRYWWALEQIAAGVGRVKKIIMEDGKPQTLWVRWEELIGKEIEGFTYNLIAKDYPKYPEILKNGGLSKAKNQKTTYNKYVEKMNELGIENNGKYGSYDEILNILKNKPDQFLRRVNVIRTSNEKESAMWEFMYTVNDIHDTLMTLMHYPDKVEEVTYRHIGTHCDHMCQFKSICQTAIEGGNVQMVKNLAYKKNEERV